MAGIWSAVKKLGGRKAGASRGGTPKSHVNKRKNKKRNSKAIRTCDWYEYAEDPDLDHITKE